ncbi:MAG: AAA family ATPase [Chloroflexota bacterium]|nr:AAA family ATPase [Chloroflexota bacterium]
MKFPYGISDFHKIVTKDYFYIDRTDRVRAIEDAGDYLLFLRPRRFGKSLWLSTLENYYDVAKADEFERLFGHLAIGQNPTPLHNQYFVLKWDFSMVDPQGEAEQIRGALHRYVNRRIQDFAITYRDILPIEIPIEPADALISFLALLAAVRETPYCLYLMVDEYDNFANEVLTASEERYYALLSGEGLLKTMFKAAKSGAAGLGVDRMFITGVSPVVMSDITSGYNVATNIYLEPEFNDLCGFTEAEVTETLRHVADKCGFSVNEIDQALTMMYTFYDGYRFDYDADESVYNPTLALYFLRQFQKHCKYPRQMLDSNLAMDRAKIAYISRLPNGGQLILDVLNEEKRVSVQLLADRFGVKDMLKATKDTTFMTSLLYYFGVLTLGGYTLDGELILGVPNLVVRKLYIERIRETLLPDPRNEEMGREAARTLYKTGDMQPLCDFVEQRYFKVFDNRDYRWANELTVKTAFLTLLFNDVLYVMDSEPALERGYADLVMIVRPDMRQYQLLDVLIEFKYVKLKKDAKMSSAEVRQLSRKALLELPKVQEKLAEARSKLDEYRQSLRGKYGDALRLRTYAVVSVGFERLAWTKVE